jgi:6-phospho-3-hexuloisomerase
MPDARSMLAQTLAETQASVEAIDTVALAAAAATVAGAPRCFVSGQGRSGLVGRMFAMRLAQLGMDAHVVGEATCPAVTTGDLFVACSGSGETGTTCYQAEKAASHGATVLAVTAKAASRLGTVANHVLAMPTAPSEQLGNSRYEHVLLLTLDTLASLVAARVGASPEQVWRRHANLE